MFPSPLTDDLFTILDNLGVAIVVASGNNAGKKINDYPAKLCNPKPKRRYCENLITVGSVRLNQYRSPQSQESDFITTHAPGDRVPAAGAAPDTYRYRSGTSEGKTWPLLTT